MVAAPFARGSPFGIPLEASSCVTPIFLTMTPDLAPPSFFCQLKPFSIASFGPPELFVLICFLVPSFSRFADPFLSLVRPCLRAKPARDVIAVYFNSSWFLIFSSDLHPGAV